MMLLRVTVGTDWKCRATVTTEILGYSRENRDELVAIQDKDVERIKAEDIEDDILLEAEEAKEEQRPVVPHSGQWPRSDRWEMDRTKPDDLRVLCGGGQGDSWSISYHIHENTGPFMGAYC